MKKIIYLVVGSLLILGTFVACANCDHVWITETTPATCTVPGFDTVTCQLCGMSEIKNETAQIAHSYNTVYSYDDSNHWIGCAGCDQTKDSAPHTFNNDDICTVCSILVPPTPGILYQISADGTYAEVVGYRGDATKLKIAEEYEGLPVTHILPEAFFNNDKITSVIIPDSVIIIDDAAFCECSFLSSVKFGNNVTTIGNNTFAACVSLTTGVIPDSVTSIGYFAFDSCNSLTKLVIGNGMTCIGENTFTWCINLTTLIVGDNVETICSYAFANCSDLATIVIPSGVTTIERSAFYDCSDVTDIYYEGSEGEWNNIRIDANNFEWIKPTVHYNYVAQPETNTP